MSDRPGRQLIGGKYELVRLIAEGGMGSVYEGRNTSTLKRCAVKLLSLPGIAEHPEIVQRFFLEARATSVLESDHIVQTYDSGIDNETGRPYLVLEFLRGEDLKSCLQRLGALEPRAAAKLILQAATGLARAHEAGILHRDIKPANLYLTRRDSGHVSVKLLDFGIAKVKSENELLGAQSLTQTGGLLGTPLYMSPEQVRSASAVDARSDVWSLGVVLFECLAGETPYIERGSIGELMSSILNAAPRNVQDVVPWVPAELAAIVQRALARDPARRFAHAGELRDALGRVLLGDSELREADLAGVAAAEKTRISPRLVPLEPPIADAASPTAVDAPPAAIAVSSEAPTPQTLDSPRAHGAEASARGDAEIVPRADLEPAAVTPPSPSTADRKRVRRALAISLSLLGLLALGLVLSPSARETPASEHAEEHAAVPSIAPALPASLPSASAAASAMQPEILTFPLRVPKDVALRVDDAPARADDGQVPISGAVGTRHRVELRKGARAETRLVVITVDGLEPRELTLDDVTMRPRAPAKKLTKSKPETRAPEAAAPLARDPGIIESTQEFDSVRRTPSLASSVAR